MPMACECMCVIMYVSMCTGHTCRFRVWRLGCPCCPSGTVLGGSGPPGCEALWGCGAHLLCAPCCWGPGQRPPRWQQEPLPAASSLPGSCWRSGMGRGRPASSHGTGCHWQPDRVELKRGCGAEAARTCECLTFLVSSGVSKDTELEEACAKGCSGTGEGGYRARVETPAIFTSCSLAAASHQSPGVWQPSPAPPGTLIACGSRQTFPGDQRGCRRARSPHRRDRAPLPHPSRQYPRGCLQTARTSSPRADPHWRPCFVFWQIPPLVTLMPVHLRRAVWPGGRRPLWPIERVGNGPKVRSQ